MRGCICGGVYCVRIPQDGKRARRVRTFVEMACRRSLPLGLLASVEKLTMVEERSRAGQVRASVVLSNRRRPLGHRL
jgi:hypothetical protein